MYSLLLWGWNFAREAGNNSSSQPNSAVLRHCMIRGGKSWRRCVASSTNDTPLTIVNWRHTFFYAHEWLSQTTYILYQYSVMGKGITFLSDRSKGPLAPMNSLEVPFIAVCKESYVVIPHFDRSQFDKNYL